VSLGDSILTLPEAPIVAALITLFGAVVLVPAVTWAINRYSERRARLTASITIHGAKQSSAISNILAERRAKLDMLERVREHNLWALEKPKSYIRLEIQNTGKKRIEHITVTTADALDRDFYQVEEGETKFIENEAEADRRIAIGDLQPHQKSVVHFWSGGDLTDRSYRYGIKNWFLISADEIDRVYFRYPVPRLVTDRFSLIPKWLTRFWFWAALIFLWIAATVSKIVMPS
jgi:hypothetical protein